MEAALVLDGRVITREVEAGNFEVLTVVGYAICPTLFSDLVEAYPHSGTEHAFRYRVKDTGRSYVLTADDVFRQALVFADMPDRRPEILEALAKAIPPGTAPGDVETTRREPRADPDRPLDVAGYLEHLAAALLAAAESAALPR